VTILTLTKSAIAPVSDLSDVLMLPQTDESYTESANADIRTYAGGRRRVISTAGDVKQIAVGFERMSRQSYLDLRDMVGVAVLFRDQRQRRMFGMFRDVSGTELAVRDGEVFNVTITIESLTVSEAV